MTAGCGDGCGIPRAEALTAAYRRVLWIVVALNVGMFVTESLAGYFGDSAALQADALDFLGDSITYGMTLWVLDKSFWMRTSVALLKGLSLSVMAVGVLCYSGFRALKDVEPEPMTMGTVAILALFVNLGSALLLFRYRMGDSNVRSVWLCSRNDTISNIAVLMAAGLVAWTGSRWPDVAVAVGIAALFLHSSLQITRTALSERRSLGTHAPAA
jgi:cation diffusion facilitator family transporter